MLLPFNAFIFSRIAIDYYGQYFYGVYHLRVSLFKMAICVDLSCQATLKLPSQAEHDATSVDVMRRGGDVECIQYAADSNDVNENEEGT